MLKVCENEEHYNHSANLKCHSTCNSTPLKCSHKGMNICVFTIWTNVHGLDVTGMDCYIYRTKENHNRNYITLKCLSVISIDNPSSDRFIHIINLEGSYETIHAAMLTTALVPFTRFLITTAIGLTIN